MAERLSADELARIRADHKCVDGYCNTCVDWVTGDADPFPCDAALLLAELDHFLPGPVMHLAGIAAGLFGPRDESDLDAVPASYPPSNRQWSD